MLQTAPIGVFDSGYGGLTVLSELRKQLPEYDFIYLGDNARAPYGNRSYDVVYDFALEAVNFLFSKGSPLVIIACNTASAKALRSIQQNDLPKISLEKRVLGVIRPSTEEIGALTHTKHVGILGTTGTIQSGSYEIELKKFAPEITVTQHACPMWVPLIENNRHNSIAGKMFIDEDVKALMEKDPLIDAIVLACTHYPVIKSHIQEILGSNVNVIAQGPIVAEKLVDYLSRHSEMEKMLSKNGTIRYFTTENKHVFDEKASQFLEEKIRSEHVEITN
ncbi:MAG: glutamate racemase [Bacteroidetes bacterium]|nr:glutamate racemase [Bacteroidota bacterium]